jgi:gas vesicle protein
MEDLALFFFSPGWNSNNLNNIIMNTKSLVTGFVAGAVLGIITGLLFAPASGEHTRKSLVKGSSRIKNNVTEYVDNSIEALRTQFNKKIDQLARHGKEAINHVSEKVKV